MDQIIYVKSFKMKTTIHKGKKKKKIVCMLNQRSK